MRLRIRYTRKIARPDESWSSNKKRSWNRRTTSWLNVSNQKSAKSKIEKQMNVRIIFLLKPAKLPLIITKPYQITQLETSLTTL